MNPDNVSDRVNYNVRIKMNKTANKYIRMVAEHVHGYSLDVLGHCYKLLRKRHSKDNIKNAEREDQLEEIAEELSDISGRLFELRKRILDELEHYEGGCGEQLAIDVTRSKLTHLVYREEFYTRMILDERVNEQFKNSCSEPLKHVKDLTRKISKIYDKRDEKCSQMLLNCIWLERALDEGVSFEEGKELEVARWQ